MERKKIRYKQNFIPWKKLIYHDLRYLLLVYFQATKSRKQTVTSVDPKFVKAHWYYSNDTSPATNSIPQIISSSSKSYRKFALNLFNAEEWWIRCTGYAGFWEFCEHLTGKRGLCHQLLVSCAKYQYKNRLFTSVLAQKSSSSYFWKSHINAKLVGELRWKLF